MISLQVWILAYRDIGEDFVQLLGPALELFVHRQLLGDNLDRFIDGAIRCSVAHLALFECSLRSGVARRSWLGSVFGCWQDEALWELYIHQNSSLHLFPANQFHSDFLFTFSKQLNVFGKLASNGFGTFSSHKVFDLLLLFVLDRYIDLKASKLVNFLDRKISSDLVTRPHSHQLH